MRQQIRKPQQFNFNREQIFIYDWLNWRIFVVGSSVLCAKFNSKNISIWLIVNVLSPIDGYRTSQNTLEYASRTDNVFWWGRNTMTGTDNSGSNSETVALV